MCNSNFCVIVKLETEIPKKNMSLGYVDDDHHFHDEVYRQVDQAFSDKLHVKKELYNSYVYSMRGDFPIKPLLLLRKEVLSLTEYRYIPYNESYDKNLLDALENATISDAIKYSQHNRYDPDPNTKFQWMTFTSWVQLDSSQNGFLHRPLEVKVRGIQLYRSFNSYYSEFGEELWILTQALRNSLREKLGPDNPFIDMITVQSIDI